MRWPSPSPRVDQYTCNAATMAIKPPINACCSKREAPLSISASPNTGLHTRSLSSMSASEFSASVICSKQFTHPANGSSDSRYPAMHWHSPPINSTFKLISHKLHCVLS